MVEQSLTSMKDDSHEQAGFKGHIFQVEPVFVAEKYSIPFVYLFKIFCIVTPFSNKYKRLEAFAYIKTYAAHIR